VVELLKLYSPGRGEMPVITTREIGHTWPMLPVFVNQPVEMRVEGRGVTIARAS
jgi:muramoyltetrapeptide carboxypeptidase LdcA involved in peptidoglycan recycling